MADIETKKIITIDASEGIRTLRQLQQAIEDDKKAIQGLDKTTEEYQQGLVRLKKDQSDYNQQMRISVKESKAVAGSYDALTAELAKLKQQWKATGDEAERSRLTKEVNRVKKQLTDMDHSIGNWQRNVGNYWDSIKAGVMGCTAAIVGAIAIFRKAGDTFVKVSHSTQNSGDALDRQVAAWNASWQVFQKSVAEFDFSGFIDRARRAAEAGRNLAAALDAVFERTNSVSLQRSAMAEDLAILQERMRDASLSTSERLQAADDYLAKIGPLYQQEQETARRTRDAQLNYILALSQAEGERDEFEQTAARERLARHIRDYNLNEESIKQANELIAAQKAVATNYQLAAGAESDAAREFYEAQAAQAQAVVDGASAEQKAVAEVVAQYNILNDAQIKGYVDAQIAYDQSVAALSNENRRVITLRNSLVAQANAADAAQTAQAQENAKKREEARQKELDAFIAALDKEMEATAAAELKAEQKANAGRGSRNAATLAGVGIWEGRAGREAQATIDDERALNARLYEIRQQGNEARLALLRRFAEEARQAGDLTALLDYEKQSADLEVEMELQATERKAQIRRQDTANAKNEAANQRQALQSVASTLGSVASSYQSFLQARVQAGKMSEAQAEREFESVKTLQYASTWINTLAGMMAIWAAQPPEPWYVKAAQSAAILTQGIAATAQIASTTLGSAAAGTSGVIQAAPVVLNAPDQTRTLTSASDEVRLNQRAQAQRVVLVYGDVEAAAKRVQVTDSESRF